MFALQMEFTAIIIYELGTSNVHGNRKKMRQQIPSHAQHTHTHTYTNSRVCVYVRMYVFI